MPGVGGVYWEFKKENIMLLVGRDIWSGLFVSVNCHACDEYMLKIKDYIEETHIL